MIYNMTLLHLIFICIHTFVPAFHSYEQLDALGPPYPCERHQQTVDIVSADVLMGRHGADYKDYNCIFVSIKDVKHVFMDQHDDVNKWKHFPRYWPFVRRIHWSPVN